MLASARHAISASGHSSVDTRDPLDDIEPGVDEHVLGHPGRRNVVEPSHPVEMRDRRIPGERL